MTEIVDYLDKQSDLHFLKGVDSKDITSAEKILDLRFANDYKSCLITFGVFTFACHEIYGLGSSDRLNVVKQTLRERSIKKLKQELYVIEDGGIGLTDKCCVKEHS